MNRAESPSCESLLGRSDPLLAMSYHDLTQEARRLRRANRQLRKALRLRSVEENACGDFVLRNPAPKSKTWRGSEPGTTRQTVLLSGIDCRPGQMDLF